MTDDGSVATVMQPLLTVPAGLTPDDEIARLASVGSVAAIVVDDDERPLWLVTPTGRQVVLRTPKDALLDDIIEVPVVVQRLAEGAAGVVVVDGGRPVGFLDADAVANHLAQGYVPRHRPMGDETLDGTRVTKPLIVVCEACGQTNELASFDAGTTQCGGGHLLVVSWA